jgi:hypothetical protein
MRSEVGTLVLFLLVHQSTRGRPDNTAISAPEKYLVGTAVARNPDLQNRPYTDTTPEFEIRGIQRGRASDAAIKFKRALGLRI